VLHFHWAKSGEYVTHVTAMGRLDWNTSIAGHLLSVGQIDVTLKFFGSNLK